MRSYHALCQNRHMCRPVEGLFAICGGLLAVFGVFFWAEDFGGFLEVVKFLCVNKY